MLGKLLRSLSVICSCLGSQEPGGGVVLGLHHPQLEFLAVMGILCNCKIMLCYIFNVGRIIIEVIIELGDIVILVAWLYTMESMVDVHIDVVQTCTHR